MESELFCLRSENVTKLICEEKRKAIFISEACCPKTQHSKNVPINSMHLGEEQRQDRSKYRV